ncbi:MAG: ABC transporter substrate-binding protein, partial [Candidatus Heimdallarchaeaceae archaeon]
VSQEKSSRKAIAVIVISFIVIAAFTSIFIYWANSPQNSRGLFGATLRYFTKGTEHLYYEEYAKSIAQDMREIGIDVTELPLEYAVFLENIFRDKDFDLALIELEGTTAPHLEYLFKQGASLNIFKFNDTFDEGYTTDLLNNISKATDFYERKNLFYSVQTHLMTDILPMVPLFTPVRTFVYWDNLRYFNPSFGLADSLPYLQFSGLHESQTSVDELNIGLLGKWIDFNPLTVVEHGEKFVLSLIMDKLTTLDEKGNPTPYGLIDEWDYVNSTFLKLHVRSDAMWQNDYEGLYENEPFTAEDVIFTLDLMIDQNANLNYEKLKWIDSYEIDTINDNYVNVYIDSDSSTAEKEPYAFALEDLSAYPYPEHYLNVSATIAQIIESSRWEKFGEFPFGTGKYVYSTTESNPNIALTFDKHANWYNVGAIDGSSLSVDFDTIEVQKVPDVLSMTYEMKEGSLDIADFGKDPVVEDSFTPLGTFRTDFQLENSIVFLAFNLENQYFGGANNFVPTTDEDTSKALATRKAIATIIDKTKINSQFHNSKFNISDTPLSTYYKDYYYPNVPKYERSIDQAIEFLELAGYNFTALGDQAPSNFISAGFGLTVASVFVTIISRRKKK